MPHSVTNRLPLWLLLQRRVNWLMPLCRPGHCPGHATVQFFRGPIPEAADLQTTAKKARSCIDLIAVLFLNMGCPDLQTDLFKNKSKPLISDFCCCFLELAAPKIPKTPPLLRPVQCRRCAALQQCRQSAHALPCFQRNLATAKIHPKKNRTGTGVVTLAFKTENLPRNCTSEAQERSPC